MAISQPTQQVQPGQQNTQTVNQVGQQQPIPQTKQTIIPPSEQINQATSAQSLRPASQSSAAQQSKQPVANQTNPQATSTDRQTNIANASGSQTSAQVESQSNNQDDHKSVPAKPSQQVENPPTSFPQPLSSQAQEAATKPATKTPTEVRGKKKQFQVQVLEEPKDRLPIVPVNTNVPQNPTGNTDVPQGTRVSPVQEVAATTVASQSGNQAATAQQILKSNTEASTENSSQTILPAKQLATEVSAQATVTQSRGTNTSQAPVVAVAQTPAIPGSPTQQLPQATPTSRPASPAVSVAQQAPSVPSQDPSNVIQQTVSVQTSLNEEQKFEASTSTKTPDVPQENIHVQSPISNHPPIHIPVGPSDTPGENDVFQTTNDAVSERSQKSHNSSETEKSTKQDDMIMQLTSSIQTQTSFDKNSITREQPKKSVERKAMEKSSSDEQAPDDSDGSVSSEKSYSRQSSDSHSAYDMDIPSAMNKNISVLQTKVDIEHWLNQVTMSSGLCLALARSLSPACPLIRASTKAWDIPFTRFSLSFFTADWYFRGRW